MPTQQSFVSSNGGFARGGVNAARFVLLDVVQSNESGIMNAGRVVLFDLDAKITTKRGMYGRHVLFKVGVFKIGVQMF